MKMNFELERTVGSAEGIPAEIRIIGKAPKYKPYVTILNTEGNSMAFIKDRQLKGFAVNILKSLGYEVTLKEVL